ncbi:MAG: undecaprenyl-phosphate galactose phosphotransferase WbaP [Pirellulales bacterium]|nr:undecaprenyl-phosphate galactose phosphotransferase WbaP [Pirellulales bacterium]
MLRKHTGKKFDLSRTGDLVPGELPASSATDSHSAQLRIEGTIGDDCPPSATTPEDILVASNVELRGTHRSQMRTPKHTNHIRGNIRQATPRSDGSVVYLRQLALTSAPLMAADLLTLLFSTLLATLCGLSWLNPADVTSTAWAWMPPVAFAMLLLNFAVGLYPGICLGLVDEIRRLSLSITIVALVAVSALRISSPLFIDRVCFLAVVYGLCIILAPIIRSRTRISLGKTSWWGFPALVCGDDASVFGVDEWLSANRRLGLIPCGVITNPTTLETEDNPSMHTGSWSQAHQLAEDKHAFWAVFVEHSESHQDVTSVVGDHLANVPHVYVVSELTGIPDHWNRHQMDEGLSGFMIEQHLLLPVQQIVKRSMDLSIALAASLLLIPLFLSLGVAIKLTSAGPIFFGHTRVGKGNSRFRAWKFRTMVQDADAMIEDYLTKHPEWREEWERDHKLRNDPRVTVLGKFMRKWSIDELPQIWNVLSGEMSIVGPRPIVDAEIVKYGDHFETFSNVPPGITGLWQVCGRNDTTYDERVQLDVYYVHHWSPWLDLYLLFRTVGTVLFTKGAY